MEFRFCLSNPVETVVVETGVEDGSWIIPVIVEKQGIFTPSSATFVRVLGVKQEEAEVRLVKTRDSNQPDGRRQERCLILISDKPFATVLITTGEVAQHTDRPYNASAEISRRVKNGKLERRPFVPKELKDHWYDDEFFTVALSDLATALNTDGFLLIERYLNVCGWENQRPNLPVVLVKHGSVKCVPILVFARGDPITKYRDFEPVELSRFVHHDKGARQPGVEVVIPRSWARRVLVLEHFGFIPGVCEQPKPSFDIHVRANLISSRPTSR